MGQTAIVNEFVDDKEAQFNFIQTWNSNNGAVQNENENSTENNSYDEDGDNNN